MTEGTTVNRIWIELEYPAVPKTGSFANSTAEQKKLGEERAAKATTILRALGDKITTFWWNERVGRYCLTTDEAGGFYELEKNGHWFNLDTLALKANALFDQD